MVNLIKEDFVNFYKTKEETLSIIENIFENPPFYKNRIETGYKLIKEVYNWKNLSDIYPSILTK